MFKRFIAFVLQRVLALRYRIRVKKTDLIYDQGVIFIPNHPAQIDPIILMAHLWARFKPRPLAVEHYYYMPGAGPFMRFVRALPIPNFETATNAWKIRRAHKTFRRIKEGLACGHNFLIYPSGHLRREGHEMVGGSLVHQLLQECPNAKVVMVRTSGLWGSSFSRAITGTAPPFWKALTHGLFVLLKNGLFFAPRRDVDIELCAAPDDFPRSGTRKELNRYIEKWMNRYLDEKGQEVSEEPVKLVSYSHFKLDVPKITRPEAKPVKDVKIDPKVRADIIAYVAQMAEVDAKKLSNETDLVRDLGLDSLDIGSLSAHIDQKYHIATLSPANLKTIGDVCQAVSGMEEASQLQIPDFEIKKCWPAEKRVHTSRAPHGFTIPEAFLDVTDRLKDTYICADALTGPLTYKKMRQAALILAARIRKMEGEYIGIMLPSSVAVYLVIFATWLAGKTPVMLNWTSGVRTLNHAQDLLNLKTVISSRRFLDRLDVLDMGALEDALVLMEDVKQSISLLEKVKGAFQAMKSNKLLLDELGLASLTGDDTAVVLFTSGTETLPKAVPLTHHNILANQAAGISCVDFTSHDTMYSVLPPFHSFGFSITGLLPILFGIPVVYAPDPTDGSMMARDISHWNVTIMLCAPTFYKNLFRVAKKEQLLSVRLFVTGAEKAPEELFSLVKQLGPDKQILEAYGITECSPGVTAQRPDCLEGVGRPLPGIELRTIHPETLQPLPKGASGEVCISGPSVFSGYLGTAPKDPFITIDGERYYRSGDIGHINKNDCLILEGRFSRFVKIGAEMVSLTAIEDAIAKKLQPSDDGPSIAIGTREGEKGAQLVLFTTVELSRDTINEWLRDVGFGRIVKISELRRLDEIPLTGTGKIHYRILEEML
ncbi:MAG: AMP-binding protein [Chlamydiales bacterium]|nr:AMP-binding protein [Chlamydiales bacterium]